MKLYERVKLATVECAGLDIRERFSLERILAADLQIADAVARSAKGDNLPSSVIEGTRDRDDALRRS